VHFNESVSDQYPASHATHEYKSSASPLVVTFFLPFSQTVQRTLPSFAVLSVGQGAQEDDPGDFENVFATQSTHSVLPASVLNFPGTQGKHAVDVVSG